MGGNRFFLDRLIDIIRLGSHEPVLDLLQQVFPLEEASINRADTFVIFALLHLHLYVQAVGAADLVVDLNRLETDAAHRRMVEQAIAGQAVSIDLTDIRNTIAYSVCPLGSTRDLQERVKVLSDLILDRSPDAVGRRFGKMVLSDLLEEHDRHEFYTSGMRKTLLQSQELLAARDDLPRQMLVITAERNLLRQQHDEMRSASERLTAMRDTEHVEQQQIRQRLDDTLTACAALSAERDAALREQAVAHAEREATAEAKDQLFVEHEELLALHGLKRDEQEAARAAYEARVGALELGLTDHQATLHLMQDRARAEQADLQALRKLLIDQSALLADRDQQRDRAAQLAGRISQLEHEVGLLAVGWTAIGWDQAEASPKLFALAGHRGSAKQMMAWRRLGDIARDAKCGSANHLTPHRLPRLTLPIDT